MVLVTSPFNWHHAVTLTFDLFKGQICCRAGDHNSPNLLVNDVIFYCSGTAAEDTRFVAVKMSNIDPLGPLVNVIFCCLGAAAEDTGFVAVKMSNVNPLGLFVNDVITFLCRLRSIAAHRDHFVWRLSVSMSVHLSLCLSGSHTFLVVTLSW